MISWQAQLSCRSSKKGILLKIKMGEWIKFYEIWIRFGNNDGLIWVKILQNLLFVARCGEAIYIKFEYHLSVCLTPKVTHLNISAKWSQIFTKNFRIILLWSIKMIYDIKDDPILQDSSQKPSAPSYSTIEDMAVLDTHILIVTSKVK